MPNRHGWRLPFRAYDAAVAAEMQTGRVPIRCIVFAGRIPGPEGSPLKVSMMRVRYLSHPYLHLFARTVLLGLAICLAAGTSAAQQDVAEPATSTALVDAIAYQPIPPGALLQTQPETQGEMDDAAWRKADSDLAARGYATAGDGALVLTVATQLVERLSSDQPIGSFNANNEAASLQGNLYNSGGRSLLNPRGGINTSDRIFRVSITVYDRASGHYVWRGSVERGNGDLDPATAMRAMIPALLDHFGQTASQVTVPIAR